MSTPRRWIRSGIVVLLLAVACGRDAEPLVLPTPGPTSLIVGPGEATFRLVATLERHGLRPGSSTPLRIDADGYPSTHGEMYVETVHELRTSAVCQPSDRTTVVHFGGRWTDPVRRPSPYMTPWMPTRFGLPPGPLSEDSFDEVRIRVWGTLGARGGAFLCASLAAQYVERA